MVSALVLTGGFLAPAGLAEAVPPVANMGMNTAMGIFMLGGYLLRARVMGRGGAALASALICFAVIALAQHLFQSYPGDGPWRLLLNTLPAAGGWPGRMSSATALMFMILASAMLLFVLRGARHVAAAFFLLALVAQAALIHLVGHLMGISLLDGHYAHSGLVRPVTAILMLLSAIGLWQLAEDRPDVSARRASSPGWDIYMRGGAASVSALLMVGGFAAGSLIQQDRDGLAVALVASLGLGLMFYMYRRIVPEQMGSADGVRSCIKASPLMTSDLCALQDLTPCRRPLHPHSRLTTPPSTAQVVLFIFPTPFTSPTCRCRSHAR